MIRIQKQLVVKEDVEFGYGKVVQKRTVDDMIVDREYDRINAENIPAKNPIGSETDIQTELNSKLDTSLGDLRYALLNGTETEEFKVANPQNVNEAVPLSRLNSDLGGHTGDTSNPHSVTKDQVGLGNVDNISDIDKPVSTATQAALDDKAPLAHVTDNANPHGVTAVQAGADPVGSADAVQDNLDDHIAEREAHGLTILGDGTNYLSDDGTYKNIDPVTVHNQLTGRDGNDTHPIESITGLRTELDAKAIAGESYLKTEHTVASLGIADAGKPIILDSAGQIDASLMGQGLYFVAMYTPDAANEYPDDTGTNTGAYWGVEGVDAVNGYTFVGGDLVGATVYNGDMVVRGELEWGYRNFGNVGGLYLRVDGSNAMTGNLSVGGNKIIDLPLATANGEAVEYSQIAGLATAYLRLDGSTPMVGNLDIGGGVNKIVNAVEEAINPTDVPNYGQLTAHADSVLNPHQVTAAQVGAEPADTDLQEHLIATDNPHSITVTQINAEPADPAIQTHLDDVSNPHSITTTQIGAEPDLGLGTAEQILATNAAVDGKEWKTLVKGDVGLGNVDNTSDIDKPVSTATQTALDTIKIGTALVGDSLQTEDGTESVAVVDIVNGLEDTGWIYPTYVNGWEDYDSDYFSKYRKIGNMVTLHVGATWTSGDPGNTKMFEMPPGFYPLNKIIGAGTTLDESVMNIYINMNGNVLSNVNDTYTEIVGTITYMVN